VATLGEELGFLLPPHTGTQRISASAWGPASTAETRSHGDADQAGSLVEHRHSGRRADGSVFETLNVFLRDRDSPDILLYAFDSLGFPPDPPARGRWDGPDLVFLRTSPRGSARTTFTPTPSGYGWSKQFRASDTDPWQDVFTEELKRS
jgi:hypothetical protein